MSKVVPVVEGMDRRAADTHFGAGAAGAAAGAPQTWTSGKRRRDSYDHTSHSGAGDSASSSDRDDDRDHLELEPGQFLTDRCEQLAERAVWTTQQSALGLQRAARCTEEGCLEGRGAGR